MDVVIVFPGGPDADGEGREMIGQFLDILRRAAGFEREQVAGAYFNDLQAAVAHLRGAPHSFVMASLGFFLAQRQALSLVPLANVQFGGDAEQQYALLVRKGAFKTTAEMAGKTLAGNTLYEDPKYLTRMVFDNQLDVTRHFVLQPTARPLSALRKLARGKLDGVLLDRGQYRSLQELPLLGELEVIYTSPLLPALGLMMTDTATTRALQAQLVKAVIEMCGSDEGRAACAGFGITGFVPVDAARMRAVIDTYEKE
ncbi:MAG: PhnD/SsuA/transferrin family substrate-binding protein [Kiritimatiellae bacterium]|nr:PhnD/SsuA/transferrin family substrate-binding protein [Kiritimatiellia bacterium]